MAWSCSDLSPKNPAGSDGSNTDYRSKGRKLIILGVLFLGREGGPKPFSEAKNFFSLVKLGAEAELVPIHQRHCAGCFLISSGAAAPSQTDKGGEAMPSLSAAGAALRGPFSAPSLFLRRLTIVAAFHKEDLATLQNVWLSPSEPFQPSRPSFSRVGDTPPSSDPPRSQKYPTHFGRIDRGKKQKDVKYSEYLLLTSSRCFQSDEQ